MTGAPRFQDPRTHVYDFLDEVLVRCPHCNNCATVACPPSEAGAPTYLNFRRRLTCGNCGYTNDRTATSAVIGVPVDPYFQLPLWLQADCRGNLLWAYNAHHLDLLAAYVAAELRERGDVAPSAPTSMLERLPTWLKTAKNRPDILKTLTRLRATLPPRAG